MIIGALVLTGASAYLVAFLLGCFPERPLSAIDADDVLSIELFDRMGVNDHKFVPDGETEAIINTASSLSGCRFLAENSVRGLMGSPMVFLINMTDGSNIELCVFGHSFSVNGIWYKDGHGESTADLMNIYLTYYM